jgi:hypothetical protein
MIIQRTLRRISRAEEVSVRQRDSGVVMRMSGGWRPIRRRSAAGGIARAIATAGVWSPVPSRSIAGQPRTCAGVGAPKVAWNQVRTAGQKASSVTTQTYGEPRAAQYAPVGCSA